MAAPRLGAVVPQWGESARGALGTDGGGVGWLDGEGPSASSWQARAGAGGATVGGGSSLGGASAMLTRCLDPSCDMVLRGV